MNRLLLATAMFLSACGPSQEEKSQVEIKQPWILQEARVQLAKEKADREVAMEIDRKKRQEAARSERKKREEATRITREQREEAARIERQKMRRGR